MYQYEVSAIDSLVEDTVQLTLRPLGKPLVFKAGQYVQARFLADGMPREEHPFSIISGPTNNNIQFAIKALGDYTISLLSIPIGTAVELTGPFGLFGCDNVPETSQIWIASGIAIAPFLSMASNLRAGAMQVQLHYFVRGQEAAIGLTSLRRISQELGENTFGLTLYRDKYTASILQQIFKSRDTAAVLACGGPELLRLVAGAAKSIGHQGTLMFDDFLEDSVTVYS